ncbi:Retrovirus-related Pol polyprotein from transposon 17.6 [Vitis vinifera]|uniref:Retrovirus-related Pol polyprotein from transposon 17.6 n=1 Tax=Vitis vinifera TaxID=29760 RepID=A0A438FFM3_VITVI|nr:Retrovirus-related Pol polyprotein from transposon 17.6 [Vitis vinifera]
MDPPQEDQNSQHGQGLIIRPHIVPLLPNFHGMESENPYAHIKEFEEVCNTFREGGASIDLMRLKLFPFTLKDKAKIWLNSLRPRSIRNWVDLQAEFLKKFFPTHRTNGLKRQISNFSAKENEKFMNVGKGIWRPSMLVLIMALIHGSCKNPEEAMDFLSYVSEVSRGWDEPNSREMGRMKAPVNPKVEYECPTMPAVREMLGDQANVVGQFRPTTMHLMETPIIQAGETIQIFLGNQATSIPTTSPNPSTSTNLFSGASHCEPKWGVFKVEGGQSCDHLEEWKEVDQPLPKVRQDEELMSKRTLVKESNNQEEKSGKKSASKSSIEEEPRIVIKEDMMKKHMPPPFPQALHGKKEIKNSSEILEDLCTVKRGLHVTKNAFLTEQVSAIIQKDVLVQVDKFYYPVDFVVLDTDPTEWGDAAHIWKHDLGIKHIPPMQEASSPEEEEGLEEPSCLLGGDGKRSYHCSMRRTHKEQLVEDPPKLVLKPLPVDLKYAYLEEDEKCPVVVSSTLTSDQEDSLLGVLRKCKKAIGWQISDLKGISPLVCTHHIHGGRCKTSEAAPEELVGEPTQVVPKKSGITVIQNEKGEEVSTRPTSGWRVCIDYRRLNSVTRKDHFPLPFMDQVLERVSGHPFYFFLDGYSGYFQIEIDLEDQEKTTFTCPFGTFAIGECPLVYVMLLQLSKDCLLHLEAVLQRCIEKDLVLNWEKCHFMVQQGIVLGHIISKNGIEDAKFVWDEKCQKSFEELKQFLTTAPIVRAPNWKLPFEVMCDASDLAMGAVLGQREDGKPYVIYYASKTLNEAQRNYTTTEKELLAVVFALDKFRAYLIDKMDPFAQEFNLQIRDKKGVENVVADHLSRLVIAHDSHGLPINDDFPEESLMSIEVAPWYSHIANYLVTGEVPSEWSAQDKRHFFAKIHAYYWEEPFLFKYCADQIIRKCVPEQEQSGILPIS